MIYEKGKFGIQEILDDPTISNEPDTQLSYEDQISEGDILQIAVYHPNRLDLMEQIHLVNERRGGIPLKVDLHRLIKEGDMYQNIVMKPGDKIYLADPSEQVALIMG